MDNRRLFYFLNDGGSKGVKTDTNGNVYIGIDSGATVLSESGGLFREDFDSWRDRKYWI